MVSKNGEESMKESLRTFPISLRTTGNSTLELTTPLQFMEYHNATQRWKTTVEKELRHLKLGYEYDGTVKVIEVLKEILGEKL